MAAYCPLSYLFSTRKLQNQYMLCIYIKSFFFDIQDSLMYTTCTKLVIERTIFVIIWVNWSKNECLSKRITCGSSGWNVRYSWYISSMSLIGLSNFFYHFEIAALLKNYVTAWMVFLHQDFIFGFNFSVWDFSFQSTQKVLGWILIKNSGSKPMTTTTWKEPLSKDFKITMNYNSSLFYLTLWKHYKCQKSFFSVAFFFHIGTLGF